MPQNFQQTFTRLTLHLLAALFIAALLSGATQIQAQTAYRVASQPTYRPPAAGVNGTRFDSQGRYLGPADPSVFPAGLSAAPAPWPPAPNSGVAANTSSTRPHHVLVQRRQLEPKEEAEPDAADQSELLKNSKDPEYILRNFKTMWVDARDAQYFGSDQMKAALGRNPEFSKLNIHIVDDPHVADVLLKVSYTFAWDYPFQLKHQNTTTVLVAGKGEGPFSGPLGAADVARQFVNAMKKWRTTEKR